MPALWLVRLQSLQHHFLSNWRMVSYSTPCSKICKCWVCKEYCMYPTPSVPQAQNKIKQVCIHQLKDSLVSKYCWECPYLLLLKAILNLFSAFGEKSATVMVSVNYSLSSRSKLLGRNFTLYNKSHAGTRNAKVFPLPVFAAART